MLKVIELFAGVGGFRLGLEKTEFFNIVLGNQWEPSKKAQDAFNCYASNFNSGVHLNQDIATIDIENIPEAEVLVGGFPCQDYSVARSLNGEQGIQGKKGVLFWEIMRLVNQLNKKPKFILLENVDRLLKSPSTQRGRDFGIMLSSLSNAGYDVEWRVINAAEYGLAQRRRRVFIFAYRSNSEYANFLKDKSNDEILFNEGLFAKKFPVEPWLNNLTKITEEEITSDILSTSDNFNAQFYNGGIMRNGKFLTQELTPIIENPTPLKEILERNVDEKYYLNEEVAKKFEYLKGPKRIERTSATGHKYIFSEGGMSFPEDLDKPGRTMLTSEGTSNRSSHVVADLDTNRLRFLTPVECERLNGFPDNWTNTGMSERMRYFCMGNALVVDLVARMGERIKEIELEFNKELVDTKKEENVSL
ncbi:DNA (cytosine-5-)-methyltransferase [Gottfriedia sp. NPDC057948]|uniref:DNA (cytosine-5-)-methyltransferase n=1 Tax=Gottfriedia sp. NPDC057948 TaxID=3346287 RepID=UPI0036DC38F7